MNAIANFFKETAKNIAIVGAFVLPLWLVIAFIGPIVTR